MKVFAYLFIFFLFFGTSRLCKAEVAAVEGHGGQPPGESSGTTTQTLAPLNVSIDSDSSSKLLIHTYYQEDANKQVDGFNVSQYYATNLSVEPAGENSKCSTPPCFTVSYGGPLYAQCGSGVNHCVPQGYSVVMDGCGKVISINPPPPKSGIDKPLERFQPTVASKHVPLTKDELDRVKYYANSPEILSKLYNDIAGPGGTSQYILGDTANYKPLKRGQESDKPISVIGNGTRWAMNAWSTNTVATFLIHMDIVRRALAQSQFAQEQAKIQTGSGHYPAQSCNVNWPEFKGHTPVPNDVPKYASYSDKVVSTLERELETTKKRIDNLAIEQNINKQANADKDPTVPPLPFAGPPTSLNGTGAPAPSAQNDIVKQLQARQAMKVRTDEENFHSATNLKTLSDKAAGNPTSAARDAMAFLFIGLHPEVDLVLKTQDNAAKLLDAQFLKLKKNDPKNAKFLEHTELEWQYWGAQSLAAKTAAEQKLMNPPSL